MQFDSNFSSRKRNQLQKKYCPACNSLGQASKLGLYKINFSEAIYLCTSTHCLFPFQEKNILPFLMKCNRFSTSKNLENQGLECCFKADHLNSVKNSVVPGFVDDFKHSKESYLDKYILDVETSPNNANTSVNLIKRTENSFSSFDSMVDSLNCDNLNDHSPSNKNELSDLLDEIIVDTNDIHEKVTVDAGTEVSAYYESSIPYCELNFPTWNNMILQWQNENNLCWLDVILHCLANSIVVRASLKTNFKTSNMTSVIYKFCLAYDDLQNKYFDIQKVNDTYPGKLLFNLIEKTVDQPKMDIFNLLKTNCCLQAGCSESVVEMLPNVLKLDKDVESAFLTVYRSEFMCNQCHYKRLHHATSSCVSFSSTPSYFHPHNASYNRICYRCHAENQTVYVTLEKVSPCIIMHFQSGLSHNNFQMLDFGLQGNLFSVFAVIQYITAPYKHFAAWIRNTKTNEWLCCDGLKSQECQWTSKDPPCFPSEQIHIIMWEKQSLTPDTPLSEYKLHLSQICNNVALKFEPYPEQDSKESILLSDDNNEDDDSADDNNNNDCNNGRQNNNVNNDDDVDSCNNDEIEDKDAHHGDNKNNTIDNNDADEAVDDDAVDHDSDNGKVNREIFQSNMAATKSPSPSFKQHQSFLVDHTSHSKKSPNNDNISSLHEHTLPSHDNHDNDDRLPPRDDYVLLSVSDSSPNTSTTADLDKFSDEIEANGQHTSVVIDGDENVSKDRKSDFDFSTRTASVAAEAVQTNPKDEKKLSVDAVNKSKTHFKSPDLFRELDELRRLESDKLLIPYNWLRPLFCPVVVLEDILQQQSRPIASECLSTVNAASSTAKSKINVDVTRCVNESCNAEASPVEDKVTISSFDGDTASVSQRRKAEDELCMTDNDRNHYFRVATVPLKIFDSTIFLDGHVIGTALISDRSDPKPSLQNDQYLDSSLSESEESFDDDRDEEWIPPSCKRRKLFDCKSSDLKLANSHIVRFLNLPQKRKPVNKNLLGGDRKFEPFTFKGQDSSSVPVAAAPIRSMSSTLLRRKRSLTDSLTCEEVDSGCGDCVSITSSMTVDVQSSANPVPVSKPFSESDEISKLLTSFASHDGATSIDTYATLSKSSFNFDDWLDDVVSKSSSCRFSTSGNDVVITSPPLPDSRSINALFDLMS